MPVVELVKPVETATKVPWLSLGASVDGAASWEDAVIRGGLDFQVALGPVRGGSTGERTMQRYRSVYRVDTGAPLAVVGSRFKPIQARRVARFMDSLIADRSMTFVRVGELEGGLRFWFLAKLDQDLIVGGDSYRPYLLGVNSHDGHRTLMMLPTLVNVRTQTTLSQAINSRGKVFAAIQHSGNTEQKLEAAKELLKATHAATVRLQHWLDVLSETLAEPEDIATVRTKLLGDGKTGRSRTAAEVFDGYYRAEVAQHGTTGYALAQTVLSYADHGVKVQSKGGGEERAIASLFGSINRIKQRGLSLVAATLQTPL